LRILFVHRARDADAARVGQDFEASGNVDGVAVELLVADDNITEVAPDPEVYALVVRNIGVAVGVQPAEQMQSAIATA
jgi:hypothetical protein